MYLVKIEANDSDINGKGVFALEAISKGTKVWVFDPAYDKSISIEEHNALSTAEQEVLSHVAYRSLTSGRYVYPPEGDPARYTNHSLENNLSVVVDTAVSSEPFFVANRDLAVGVEITNNYLEFDEVTKAHKPDWV